MNFVRKSLNSLVKLQQMFRIEEIELGMENTIGITLETCVGVQSAILYVCRFVKYQEHTHTGNTREATHFKRVQHLSLFGR